MSEAPLWLDSVIKDFGEGAGLRDFSLGERGVAALQLANGLIFSVEYFAEKLIVRMTANVPQTADVAKKVLLLAEPSRQGNLAIRTGFMPKSEKAFFAITLPQSSVTQPLLSEAFRDVRRVAERFVGGSL